MEQGPIIEKFDLIVNLTSQIADQEPEEVISDIFQAVILARSLLSEYNTTLEILTNKEEFPKLYEVFETAKTYETKLSEPETNVTAIDIANVVGKELREGKVYWVCQENHAKPKCPKCLAT